MAEWLKAVDSKSTVPLWYRGFESLPLRHEAGVKFKGQVLSAGRGGQGLKQSCAPPSLKLNHLTLTTFPERCESGRIGAPGERVGAKSVPWVRIPPSPLKQVVLGGWCHGQRVVVLGGEVAVPCNPQAAIAGQNSHG